MNKRLIDALISISNASTSAKALADQVLAENGTDLVRQLRAQIAELETKIHDLTVAVDVPEVISEEERAELVQNLTARVRNIEGDGILRFDRTYLKLYPKQIRPIVAQVLINAARNAQLPPLPVWLDVIALDGEIA